MCFEPNLITVYNARTLYQENLKESRSSGNSLKVQVQKLQEELNTETRVLKSQSDEQRKNREIEGAQLNDLLNKVKESYNRTGLSGLLNMVTSWSMPSVLAPHQCLFYLFIYLFGVLRRF